MFAEALRRADDRLDVPLAEEVERAPVVQPVIAREEEARVGQGESCGKAARTAARPGSVEGADHLPRGIEKLALGDVEREQLAGLAALVDSLP